MFCRVLLTVLLLATVVTLLARPLEARPAAVGAGEAEVSPLEQDHAGQAGEGPGSSSLHLSATRQKRRALSDEGPDRDAAKVEAEVSTGTQQRFRRNLHIRDNDDDAAADKRAFQPWGGKRQAEIPEATWDALADDVDAADAEAARIQARSFNPWGGKRSSDEKRKFQPWGGKRSGGDDLKRKFQPWGGKRQVLDVEDLKRRFNPWAGKRAVDIEHEDDVMLTEMDDDNDDDVSAVDEMEKRGFQPWGGKRSSFQPWGGKRASFQPWGGKRASFQPWGGKRASFQPWGGKRASFQPWGGKRASFQPWGGKRASFQPWGGKRASFQPWGGKRASFQPWGGKRASFQPWGGKRGFQPWGGKRSGDDLTEEDVQFLGEEKPWAGKQSRDNELDMPSMYHQREAESRERN